MGPKREFGMRRGRQREFCTVDSLRATSPVALVARRSTVGAGAPRVGVTPGAGAGARGEGVTPSPGVGANAHSYPLWLTNEVDP